MKTKDELNSMTKKQLLAYIGANEVLPKVDQDRGLMLGQVCYVEEIGRSIADKRTCFHAIIHADTDADGSLVITCPSTARVEAENLATMMEINRAISKRKGPHGLDHHDFSI